MCQGEGVGAGVYKLLSHISIDLGSGSNALTGAVIGFSGEKRGKGCGQQKLKAGIDRGCQAWPTQAMMTVLYRWKSCLSSSLSCKHPLSEATCMIICPKKKNWSAGFCLTSHEAHLKSTTWFILECLYKNSNTFIVSSPPSSFFSLLNGTASPAWHIHITSAIVEL